MCKTFAKYNDKLTFEALAEMEYLELVFLEVLRLHSPAPSLSRVCTHRFTLPSIGKNPPVTIEPGTIVQIPVRALHLWVLTFNLFSVSVRSLVNFDKFLLFFLLRRDPDYFPNPEQFDPDRFSSPEARNNPIYLPFGDGPRTCIGYRFASIQVRIALVHLVKHFRLSVSPNHKPIEFVVQNILHAKDGLLINFETRNWKRLKVVATDYTFFK